MDGAAVIVRTVPAMPADPYLPLVVLSRYSGLSVRRLRDYLHDAVQPLPHYRVGGKILVRQSDYDAWVGRLRVAESPAIDQLVSETLRGL